MLYCSNVIYKIREICPGECSLNIKQVGMRRRDCIPGKGVFSHDTKQELKKKIMISVE